MAADLDRERWQRVSPILEAALELPPAARAAYLNESCGGDTELRRNVEELLAAEASAGSFLSEGALERGAPLVAELAGGAPALPPTPATGRLVGVYRLVAELGEGGMGTVHLAERVDGHFEQRVAIKLLKQGLADDDAKRRFLQERQILARLDHPGIARLIDGGVTAEGTPFFVMERVEGRPVTNYCDEQGFGIEQRLRVFLEICDAVQYAHGSRVVHRDIKPSNILVDAAGRVKLLDFGIAKLLAAGSGSSPLEATRTFVRAMTPEYAAPEQVRNEPVTPATDVYSLGVLLYELLTGQRPYQVGRGALSEMERAILEQEPLRPSARTGTSPGPTGTGGARETRRRLRGDLDRIVLKALEKAPERRYPTAQALAADIRRHLDGLPITARGDNALYRARKFLRRHRAGVAAAAISVAAVLVAVVAILVLRPAPIDSLAVLPFANASQDRDTEYLGDGLADSLIDQMSRVPSLQVMARTTVFRFKGTADPREAGRKLGVGAVLTGTVSRRGDQVKVSAELVETSTGARLWGETYDRPVAELQRVQDNIASDISDGLRLRLSGQEKRTLARHGTENPEAYELYLRARFLLQRDTEDDDLEARRLFERAVERDPKFVGAHLGVASTYSRAAGNGYAPPAATWARADEEIRKVLQLDPGNVLARCSVASRRFLIDWDWAGAEREMRDVSADPWLLLGPQFHAVTMFFWARGRPEESVALVERALRVDPGNLESRIMLADFLVQAGRLDDAMGSYKAVAEAEPSDPRSRFGLAEVLRRRGDMKGAIDALRQAYELSGEEEGTTALTAARTEKDLENAEIVVARSRLVRLEAAAKERYVSPLDLARLYAQVGDREKAFARLQAALAERSPGLVLLKVDHAWDRIRDDARFTAVVRRVGIP